MFYFILFYCNPPKTFFSLEFMDCDELSAISPIDGRYRSKVASLANFFSEYALHKHRVALPPPLMKRRLLLLHSRETGRWEGATESSAMGLPGSSGDRVLPCPLGHGHRQKRRRRRGQARESRDRPSQAAFNLPGLFKGRCTQD